MVNQTRKQRKWGWRTSPAETNEDCSMELSRVGRSAVCGLLNLQKTEELDILFLSKLDSCSMLSKALLE